MAKFEPRCSYKIVLIKKKACIPNQSNQSVGLLNTVTLCLNCKFGLAELATKPKSGRNTKLHIRTADIKVWNKFSVEYKPK